ncbi:MAG: VWA domain-containing protein [Verrucomicrobia bacterium]|nr:VWA domain-containing protein [Verrucomicrobiota bacterium]
MKRIFMRPLLAGTALTFLLSAFSSLMGQSSIDHVVIVLDASGSMKQKMPSSNQPKMEAAKEALIEVLSNIPQTTHIGLLVFSAADVKDHWVYPLASRKDDELLPAIRNIRPNRGTPLGRYIKIGADRLLEERAKQFGYGTYRLLIVTDGEANDRNLVEQYTPEVLSRGLRMDVIGVAMDRDHTLATKVHTYRRANDANTLKQAIAEVFAEVGGNQAGNVADNDAFELLAPIPVEVASAAINALSQSGNNPIGESRTNSPDVEQAASNTTAQHTITHTRTVQPEGMGSVLKLVILGGLVLLVLLKAITKR